MAKIQIIDDAGKISDIERVFGARNDIKWCPRTRCLTGDENVIIRQMRQLNLTGKGNMAVYQLVQL